MSKKTTTIQILLGILLLNFFVLQVKAQENSVSQNEIYESIIESLAEELDESSDLVTMVEDLMNLAANPINVNQATYEDLEVIFFLSSYQIENLLQYIRNFGQIYSIYEIENINGFSSDLANKLSHFIVFGTTNRATKSYLNQQASFRTQYGIEKPNGFIENADEIKDYVGIRPALYATYRATYGTKYRWGITFDNDIGEPFFSGSNKQGFDYYGVYFSVKGKKILDEMIIGKFGVKFGQGLTQWTGYSSRKSSEISNIRYTGQGIRPYTSSAENDYLNGIAAKLRWHDFKFIVFGSSKNIDANIDSIDAIPVATSRQTSGYHRTLNEIEDENSLRVQTTGSNISYSKSKIALSVNGIYEQYALPIYTSNELYKIHNFRGTDNYNLSIDFQYRLNKINFFGESAVSKSKGKAFIAGVESQLANEFLFNLSFRNFDSNYHSIGGSALSEWSNVQNESGILATFSILPIRKIKVNGYLDTYQSKWLRYNSNSPVQGTDFQTQINYAPSKRLTLYLRYKDEINSEKTSIPMTIKKDVAQRLQKTRINLQYEINEQITLKTRIETSLYKKELINDRGILCFIESSYSSVNNLFKLNTRIAWFNIASYNSRIYTYESDLPSLFYIPSFSGKGIRYYLTGNYKVNQKTTLYLKFAQVIFPKNIVAISTGNNEILGNHKSDLKLELKYRF